MKSRIEISQNLLRVHAKPEILQQIYSALSYRLPDYERTKKYKEGKWDGMIRLFSTYTRICPVGFLKRVQKIVGDHELVVLGSCLGEPTCTAFNFPELREYQKEIINSALEYENAIIGLPTGSGKTAIALNIIHLIGRTAVILVMTKELLYQWKDQIEKVLKVDCGVVGDGARDEKDITVAMVQSILKTPLKKDYGVLIFDECHRTSAAEKFYVIGKQIKSYYRFGLSATPWRSVQGEELKIEGAISGNFLSLPIQPMIDDGFLAEPFFEIIPSGIRPDFSFFEKGYQATYDALIVHNSFRNKLIAWKAVDMSKQGFKVLIAVNRIRHGELIQEALQDLGRQVDFAHGILSSGRRKQMLDEFAAAEGSIIISTLLKEGVDIPSISGIILAGGGKSDISVIQSIGRALRPSKNNQALIVDFDDGGPFLEKHSQERRAAMAEYYGESYKNNLTKRI